MRLAMVAAKFSGPEANELRRAMATFRRRGTIERLHQKMVGRMTARGYPAEFAERCFNQIKGFGEYGFPESHAASFAHLVYVSAWIKCHYPAAFAAALLNSQPMGFYAPAQIVRLRARAWRRGARGRHQSEPLGLHAGARLSLPRKGGGCRCTLCSDGWGSCCKTNNWVRPPPRPSPFQGEGDNLRAAARASPDRRLARGGREAPRRGARSSPRRSHPHLFMPPAHLGLTSLPLEGEVAMATAIARMGVMNAEWIDSTPFPSPPPQGGGRFRDVRDLWRRSGARAREPREARERRCLPLSRARPPPGAVGGARPAEGNPAAALRPRRCGGDRRRGFSGASRHAALGACGERLPHAQTLAQSPSHELLARARQPSAHRCLRRSQADTRRRAGERRRCRARAPAPGLGARRGVHDHRGRDRASPIR